MSKVLTELRNSDNFVEHEKGQNVSQDVVVDTSSEFVVLEKGLHPLQRLLGHEGSIHRLTWSSDGLTLVSVSDDRRFVNPNENKDLKFFVGSCQPALFWRIFVILLTTRSI